MKRFARDSERGCPQGITPEFYFLRRVQLLPHLTCPAPSLRPHKPPKDRGIRLGEWPVSHHMGSQPHAPQRAVAQRAQWPGSRGWDQGTGWGVEEGP